MLKFPIPPEYCLIINAFNQADSLRGAAVILGMDPPALVRKVQKISAELGYLQKVGNRWAVTESGRRVAQWTDEVLRSQSELAQEKSALRISSFSWLAEEVLIPEYHLLKQMLPAHQSILFKITATNQEQELIQSRADLIIQGHAPTDPCIAHKRVSSHPWVVVIPFAWKKRISYLSDAQIIEFLNRNPFIRHSNLNPETALGFQPRTKALLTVDGVIGLRSAVTHNEGWTVLPAMSVRHLVHDNKLIKLNLQTFIKDDVSVWWIRARKDMSAIAKTTAKWISELQLNY
jgi:DNA-binding transcriptional LysR family regulator